MHHSCNTLGMMAATAMLAAGTGSVSAVSATHSSDVEITAAPTDTQFLLHTCYSSAYLWRGLDLGDDLIEAGAVVTAKWSGLDLSAGAWYGSFDAPAGDDSILTNELDLFCEVAKDFGFIKGSVGYIAYLYPNEDIHSSGEVYFGLSRDFGFVAASLKYFWSVQGASNDGYSEFALSRSFTLSPCLALNLESNIGYLVDQGLDTAWTSKVSLDWGFAERAKLSPYVAVAVALSDDDDTAYTGTGNELVGGCKLSVTF